MPDIGSSNALRAETLPLRALDPSTRDAMWALFRRHYDGVNRAEFNRDLAHKQHVIVLRDRREGVLRGFSTLQGYVRRAGGRRVGVVYSGDTIVDPRYWGQSALQLAFFRYTVRFRLLHPTIPVYWFLISKGYKTYLLLCRNFLEYWPRRERPTPLRERALIHGLALERFGRAWRPELGVLRFGEESCRLREEVAPIDERLRERSPEVRFFEVRNPGHARGDELCCIGKINLRLWLFYLGRVVRKGWARC